MKIRIVFFLFFIFVLLPVARAQDPVFIPIDPKGKDNAVSDSVRNESRSALPVADLNSVPASNDTASHKPKRYGWLVDPRSGERKMTDVSKTLYNFHQTSIADGQGIAIGYLGNMGSPMQSKLFFERGEAGLYPFLNAFEYYYKKAEEHPFLNTTQPYSNIFYQTGGGRMNKEERLKGEMSLNLGKKINVGFDIDYIYSRGFYAYLSNKQVTYDIYGSYISDKYQLHAFFSNNYYNNSENGGIADDRFITDPTNPDIQSQLAEGSGSKDIPTKTESLWNRLSGRQIFLSNKYNVGYEKQETNEFVPVASFILTTNYRDQKRRFASRDNTYIAVDTSTGQNLTSTDTLYYPKPGIKYASPADDEMAFWSFKNTFAVTLNEGFKDWVKFGLTAFVEQDFRKYSMPSKSLRFPGIVEEYSQNSTVIGGMLTKQKGPFLTYNLKADFGIVGDNLGELRAEADINTNFKIAGKDASVRAKGYVKNLKPTFYENNYNSKYFEWKNDFDDVRRFFVGGEIIIPYTNTRISGGVESIDNYIYYTKDTILQSSKNIQVVSLRLDQKLKAGIFHWDNQIAYQLSSEKDVLPLPTLSFYTNAYILTDIIKVLTIQLGVDAHFHTKYYAPAYDPATIQFHNQKEVKIGGFPIATAYMNINLKNTRFFLMVYNVGESLFNSEYFSLPHYPVNPLVFKMGISWDFNN
ncbi:MAG: putative porin [Dysgonomonas sp.]